MHVSKLHNYQQQQQQFRFLQAEATTTTTPETTTTIATKCPILPSTLISGIHESLPPFILLQNLVFYQIHYSTVLRLTPFLGFIYDSLDFLRLQVHVPQKPQKKRVDIIFFLLVDFKNGFVSMKGCRKRGLPVGYYYFLPKIDRVLMLQSFLFFTICTPKTTKAKTRKRLQLIHLSL